MAEIRHLGIYEFYERDRASQSIKQRHPPIHIVHIFIELKKKAHFRILEKFPNSYCLHRLGYFRPYYLSVRPP